MKAASAFTLAELLISLTILGVIATFTIPKVLASQQTSMFNARAKEALSMISGAYQAYLYQNTIASSTTPGNFTSFMNYIAVDTSTVLDTETGGTSFPCGGSSGGTITCLKLHNGATLEYNTGGSFGGTATTNALFFYLDPDSQYSGTTNGPGKSIVFFLYTTGRITSGPNILPNTINGIYGGSTYNPGVIQDPTWFTW